MLSVLPHFLSEYVETITSFGVSYVAVKGVEVDYRVKAFTLYVYRPNL